MSQQINLDFPLWPKQRAALESPANELVYGGAAGPGKSHLLRVAFIKWALEIPGLQLYLFRRKFRDLIQGHMEGKTGFRAMLQPAVEAGAVESVGLEMRFANGMNGSFVGGSRISLNHCQHEDDVFNYKTIEFNVLGLEETTEFSPFQIKFLRSRVRMPDAIKIPEKYLMPKEFWRTPDKPRYSFPRCLYPTNPGGPGHDYIKRNWIDEHTPLELWNASTDEGGMLRQFIPGLLADNPSVNPDEYAYTLSGLPPAYRDALLYGKWTAAVGSYYPEFDFDRHVIDPFDIPQHWFRFRTFDWGSAEPFAVHWWAVSPGETIQGRFFPRRSLVCFNEWYGSEVNDGAKGLGMPNAEIAGGILRRSEPDFQKVITLSDSFPFQDRGGWTIETVFRDNGVPLHQGDTSRVAGWSQLRDRLTGVEIEVGRPRYPMMYIFRRCKALISYIPSLQYHPSESKPQDAAEHGEATHCCDSARLAAMAWPIVKDAEKETVREYQTADKMTPKSILDGIRRSTNRAKLTRR